jgi:hypothetical protein
MLVTIMAMGAGVDLSQFGRRGFRAMMEGGLAHNHTLAVAVWADHEVHRVK